MRRETRVAVIGAGLGGTTAAALLQRAGFAVRLYEQAPAFERIGAGIHLSPNLMQVLRAVGVADRLERIGLHPDAFLSRAWDSGEVLFRLPLGEAGERRYGAPYINVHRGDLHAALASAVAPDSIAFGHRLAGIETRGDGCRLLFGNGATAEADIVIGADGVNSRVRELVLGVEKPRYTGHVAHRCIVPAAAVDPPPADCTKWWGPDRHLLIYYMTGRRDELYLVTSFPEPELTVAGAWAPCDADEFRAELAGFHPEVRRVAAAAGAVTKWPVFDREPVPVWSEGRLVLLGDACHPLRPYMAQGAAMAIEDAAVLARCLIEALASDPLAAFPRYARNRLERTNRVQRVSVANDFLRGPTDPAWVFDYDAWTVPLLD
ncbi:FAD-dependent monooxygenase [Roseomonas sp. NAR14]|uniref:FAD-dependent monooxygenase n=1 Tax=Roseomonas acroporae TaxID=2937791 RepID=A0A9X1YDL2_9PROT|nr:FAD-dependent monooxygenase [Roseomonas acroporae]MCK8787070.1 FAD-dependent monooxygenase [Roseomonas acroporae]